MIGETVSHYPPEVDPPLADKIIDPAKRDGEGGPVTPKHIVFNEGSL